MRFTETKNKTPWILLVIGIIIGFFLVVGFCDFKPTPKTVRKTVVFEAD